MFLQTPHRRLLFVIGLLLLSFGLRVYRLDYQSIWWDEGISLHLATSGIGEIVRDRLNNIHPPLYFILLKGWLSLVGVSPFTGRYLSALAALGQVALVISATVYWAGQTFPRSTGRGFANRNSLRWVAGGLIALSPLSVIYGQEIRVYALLPLAYLTMLLLTSVILSGDFVAQKPLLLLALTEWVGLHLHYILVFGVIYVGLWGVIVLARRGDRSSLTRWLAVQSVIIIASLPWLIAVLWNWGAVQAEANAGTFTAEPVSLHFLFAQVWIFHLTGLAGALAEQFVRMFSVVVAIMTAALLAIRLALPSIANTEFMARLPARNIARLSVQWGLPLLSALVVWSVRSFSHPRYIVAFAIGLIPLFAFLVIPARSWLPRILGLVLVGSVGVLSLWGLNEYYFNPQRAKPDMRGVAQYLATNAGPRDVILIPDTDWSLPFEYKGTARVQMPDLSQSAHDPASTLATTLACLPDGSGQNACRQPERVFAVDYPRGTRDWQNRLPFELERRGYWSRQIDFNGVLVNEYRIEKPVEILPACGSTTPPETNGLPAQFGVLHLDSAYVETVAAADTAVAVALCWQVTERVQDDLVVSLVVRDPLTGERLGQVDSRLVDSTGAPTSSWQPRQQIVTYHVLPLPVGAPPISTSMFASVYAPEEAGILPIDISNSSGVTGDLELVLSEVSLISPVGLNPSPYTKADQPPWGDKPEETAPGLLFLGTYGLPTQVRPGQTIRVPLAWQATAGDLPDIRPVLSLEQDGREIVQIASAPAQERAPTNLWEPGQIVQEFRDLRVPGSIDGDLKLVLRVEDQRIELAKIAFDEEAAVFERPSIANPTDVVWSDAIKLIGFDLPATTLTAGEPFPLTLYWESLANEIPTGYSVFIHAVAQDGRIVAQHDGPPANGQRPTYDWLIGEFITDSHPVEWREPDFVGPAQLLIGLYNPLTGERLPTTTGEDSYPLPAVLTIEPND